MPPSTCAGPRWYLEPCVRRLRALCNLAVEVESAESVSGLLSERPRTMHPINADVHDAMQQGALLINLGCGSLLRERALVRRMRTAARWRGA